MTRRLLFTCEHGGNHIPPACIKYFKGSGKILESHRGWDAGALDLAHHLQSALAAPLVYSETSRLLIDLNRSLHHRQLFSEFTRPCDRETRQQIINHYYLPYRDEVENRVRELIRKQGAVLHFSIHSFTPRLDNYLRKTDIGLLYDPARKHERRLCEALQKNMQGQAAQWTVRRNYPYRGTADGLTTHLRKIYAGKIYCGIEIEVNQKFVVRQHEWHALLEMMTEAIRSLCNNHE